ncbi:hypothetical protein B0H17DRAFT_1151711 [Mycena rosella]|uniref:Uncharacterized protein n=1 Tax=Mycena rosella TaxID=1033263 RepID=A0AAD7BI06_MYCRO|nr:hypothetical protein B0H17DRAFT_1151711 [Mycena rosella]
MYHGEFMSGRKYGLPHIHNPHSWAPVQQFMEWLMVVCGWEVGNILSIACPSDLSECNEKKLWELKKKVAGTQWEKKLRELEKKVAGTPSSRNFSRTTQNDSKTCGNCKKKLKKLREQKKVAALINVHLDPHSTSNVTSPSTDKTTKEFPSVFYTGLPDSTQGAFLDGLPNETMEAEGAGPLSRPSSTLEGLRLVEPRRLMINSAIAATMMTPLMLNPTITPTWW